MTNKEITKRNVRRVKNLLEEVKKLIPEKFQETLDSLAKFHNYSLYNQIILCFAGCSQVAGYKKWKALGRTVKKGGKAVWILAPWFKKVKDEKDQKNEDLKLLSGFFSVPVFDIGQTEGEPVKRGITIGSDIDFEELRKATEKAGWTVVFKPLEIAKGGYVTSENGEITLNSNLDKTENTGTLVHEWVHKELKHPDNGTPARVAEQQAETATYLVCKVLGIERKSVFYLKSWGLSENILKDFAKVDKVVKKIIRGLSPDRQEAPERSTDNEHSSKEV